MVVVSRPSVCAVRCTLMSSWPLASFITRSVMTLPYQSTLVVGAEMMEPSTFRMESRPAPWPVASVPGT